MVVEQVQKAIGNDKKFTINTHILCWRKYKVRPESNALDPTQTDGIYCIYDEPNKSYLYTKTWVNFLIEKMRIQEEYDSLSSYQKHK